MAKMTDEQKTEWKILYEYIKKLLGYDENQGLPKNIILRITGLRNGKFINNNNIQSTANYSDVVILNTFKAYSQEIAWALKNKEFKNEQNKINYICKIVESHLNDIYLKMKNAESTKERIDSVNTTIANYKGAKYKTKENINDKFPELW